MKAKTFGLDIGTTAVKALWLGKKDNRLVLESVASAATGPRGILSDSFLDQQKFADFIRGMLENAHITIPNVNIALPESQIYSRVFEMPNLSEKELSIALQFEMEQYVPLPLDQVRTDFDILERREEVGKKVMSVLVVAAPLGTLTKYEKVINLIGLKTETIETEMVSVFRCLFPLLSPASPDVIVHIGASTTSVAIARNKVINAIFSIPLGGVAITRAVSLDLGIEMTEAEVFKKVYGAKETMFEGKIGKALSPILESIVGDVRRGILSYKEKNQGVQLRQVILSGGSALMPGIDIFFTHGLDAQVVIGNCWQIYGVGNVPHELMEQASGYNVAVGLALRDVL